MKLEKKSPIVTLQLYLYILQPNTFSILHLYPCYAHNLVEILESYVY